MSAPSDGPFDRDVIVIGGGVNGTGVARDCALRGLSVALFERNDIAFGASGNSSGMIHGGGRYLTSDPHVTETSCRDSGHIQAIAPHLIKNLPFDPRSDFDLLTVAVQAPNVLVVPANSPHKSVADVLAYQKANPLK